MSERAFRSIANERKVQDSRWGIQRHEWPFWAAILAEETGEVCREAISPFLELEQLRAELVQTAAVAVAMIEHVDELLEA